MQTLEVILAILLVLLGLGVGIAVVYLCLAAMGFVLLIPFYIACGVVSVVIVVISVGVSLVREAALGALAFIGRLFGFGVARKRASSGKSKQEEGKRANVPKHKTFDPYFVLHVARGADRKEIKQAYYLQMSKYHPDKVSHLGEEFQALAEEKAKSIQRAYSALS